MIAIITLIAIVLFTLLYLDYRQTLIIALHPNMWREKNPILGAHPTVRRVRWHFVLTVLATLAGLILLPMYFTVMGGAFFVFMEVLCVVSNWRHGIRVWSWRL